MHPLVRTYPFIFAGACCLLLGARYVRRVIIQGETLTAYRDKSALYGRTLAPGEAPSWP